MNETETNLPSSNSELEWQVASLQRQVFLLLLGLVVVTATLVFFLFCESHFMADDLAQATPQAMQVIQTYSRNAVAIENIDKTLVEYGRSNPAYQPILAKYGLIQPANAPRQ